MAQDDKPSSPLGSYLMILCISFVIAWIFFKPLGEQIRDFLQSVVDVFNARFGGGDYQ